ASQLAGLRPVIEQLSASNILVSVETYSAAVSAGALACGAKILNLTGTRQAETIYGLAAEREAAVIICYVEAEDVRSAGDFELSADPIPKMERYFTQQLNLATRSGVTRIFLDPGLGFYYRNLQDSAVRLRHQITTFLNTFRLRKLGFPICHALPHAFEYFGEEVRTAEAVFAVLASIGRTDLFRTHEVGKVKAVLDLLAVIDPSDGDQSR
ncbi:MAG TPA: dihydropteroate synthase, partial [Verrucomicrobiae bacterium]|nr:dihydropteroate synthase [Verrucomicrobiae bacterium]